MVQFYVPTHRLLPFACNAEANDFIKIVKVTVDYIRFQRKLD